MCSVCGIVYEGRRLNPDLSVAPFGRTLFVTVDGRGYCSSCWFAAGRPWPKKAVKQTAEVALVEAGIRRKMQERGGLSRHLVRKGST